MAKKSSSFILPQGKEHIPSCIYLSRNIRQALKYQSTLQQISMSSIVEKGMNYYFKRKQ